MPKVLNREARRKEILEAATRVFATKGYTRGTLKDIALEANISTGSLYYLYRTKEDIFWDNLGYLIDQTVVELEQFIDNQNTLLFEDYQQIVFESLKSNMKNFHNYVFMEFMLEAVYSGQYDHYLEKMKEIADKFSTLQEKMFQKIYADHPLQEHPDLLKTVGKLFFFIHQGIFFSYFTGKMGYSPDGVDQLQSELAHLYKHIDFKLNT